MRTSRRSFLEGLAALLCGCSEDDRSPLSASCAQTLAGGAFLGIAPFADPVEVPLNVKVGQGWDARLYHDLSALDPRNLVTQNELFYLRTELPDLIDTSSPWTIELGGLAAPTTLTLDDLAPLVRDQGVHLLECSGNGSGGAFGLMSAARWGGASLSEVLELSSLDPRATRVRINGFDEHSVPSKNGHSTPGASWVFRFDDLAEAFLATEMNGEPLTPDHGAPVRLFVPGWYGCACIKWVDQIWLVDEDEPATSQMQEFATRTHQSGTPDLARDYLPATIDQAAMPVRMEKWRLDGRLAYRLVGITWGGRPPSDAIDLVIGTFPPERVTLCDPPDGRSWTLWEHVFFPPATGSYPIRMRVADPLVPTRRLDLGWYTRTIEFDEI